MTNNTRISSLDIMRGVTLLLMLFVNDLFMPGLPSWLGHKPADSDGMGLADWVFPGFLFMVGMAIPFSLGKRISEGQDNLTISKHILKRSISLIVIGVLMLNSERVNPELTGIGKNLWTIFMYIGAFLVWNNYQENDKNFFTITGLRLAGLVILIALVFKFRSGEFENGGSLITSWWGIPGMIGWGYMVTAFIHLAVRDNILNTVVAFLFFLSFNILSKLDLLSSLNVVKPILGVLIEGNVPLMVISGMLISIIVRRFSQKSVPGTIVTIVTIGAASIIAGFLLHNWFVISKIQATPSWALLCNGISMILFALLYWIVDVKEKKGWAVFLIPAGENSLTAYLLPYILYSLILSTGAPVFIYKQSGIPLIAIAGSVIWAFVIILLTKLLVKFNIRLKL